jgi:cob(I)alamin adenosyltransferase
MTQGLIYVFAGDGKGKTSAAIGVAVRAAGAGMSVGWVAFYKQDNWRLSEMEVLKKIGVKVFLMGKGFYFKQQVKTVRVGKDGVVVDTATGEEHRKAAEAALERARSLIGQVEVLVLDEVNNAVKDKLIKSIDLIALISKRGKTHIILTGRDAQAELIELADLVTEMRKVKHPYDQGKLAVRGLDF